MPIKPILKVPNTKLITMCEPITKFDEETKQLANDLIDTVLAAKNPEGAGLAAPQTGILKRICVVRKFLHDPEKQMETTSNEIILINPEITNKSAATDVKWEACLSIPDTYGKVQRAKRVTVVAKDIDGNDIKLKATGFFAHVVQHELDHLDGVLFTTKVTGEILSETEFDEMLGRQYESNN